MAAELYKENATFKATMASCAKILEAKYGFNLLQNFDMEKGWEDMMSTAVGLTAIQIGLVDVLAKDYSVSPAGIIGHSAGMSIDMFLHGKCRQSLSLLRVSLSTNLKGRVYVLQP